MPVSGEELVTLLIALGVIVVVILLIRRAANKSQPLGDKPLGDKPLGDKPLGDRIPDRPHHDKESQIARQIARPSATADIDDDENELDSEDAEPDQGDTEAEEERLLEGLAKTRSAGFVSRLGKLFSRKKIDSSLIEELEEVLFTADIGPQTAERLLQAIKDALSKSELDDPKAVWQMLRDESVKILEVPSTPIKMAEHQPFVLLVLGVNGAGKTTTIGKLAAKLKAEGKSVLLAAGDTFRAAAVEQLEVWAKRSECPVVKGNDGQDPSSVIFDAIRKGKEENYDVVICDTAGRLHTKTELMEELKKVGRVCEKALPGCPHETWLVLDSTTGQNAIQQAVHFKAAMNITGIVLTKLDGTAKGGVILGIAQEMQVPIRYIGIGEQIDDLRSFAPKAFVSALYQDGQSHDLADDMGSGVA